MIHHVGEVLFTPGRMPSERTYLVLVLLASWASLALAFREVLRSRNEVSLGFLGFSFLHTCSNPRFEHVTGGRICPTRSEKRLWNTYTSCPFLLRTGSSKPIPTAQLSRRRRRMLKDLSLELSVVGLTPRISAAPPGPAIFHFASSSACKMFFRSKD